MEPAPKRAKRECPICAKTYCKLTDHLAKAHKLATKEEREPYMKEAKEKTPDLRITKRLGVEGASGHTKPNRNSYPCPFPHCGSRKYSRLADHLTTSHRLIGAGWQRLRRLLLDISHRMEEDDLLEKERTLLSRLPVKVEDYMQPAASSKLYDFPARCSRRLCNSLLEDAVDKELERKISGGLEDGLIQVDVEGKGRGVIAARPFSAGDFLCEYAGERIEESEARKREKEYVKDSSIGSYMYYFVHKSKKLCVDATRESGRLGRLVNHSSIEYNAISKVVEIKGTPYLCLFSSRDISVGEELLFDYGERRRDVVNSLDWLKS